MKMRSLLTVLAVALVTAARADTPKHEVRAYLGNPTSHLIQTGVDTGSSYFSWDLELTTFGLSVGYGYALTERLQLTANLSGAYANGPLGNHTSGSYSAWSIAPGLRYNFGSEEFHSSYWTGFSIGVAGASRGLMSTVSVASIDFGRRFQLSGNVSYAPFVQASILDLRKTRFSAVPLAFNFTF